MLGYALHGAPGAPCIVLCQGLGMSAADWPRDLVYGLAQTHCVVVADNRDAGASPRFGPDHDPDAVSELEKEAQGIPFQPRYSLDTMRDDVLRLTDFLGIRKFAILGFSMGGMIAQRVAAACPERVWSMVQVCSSAGEAKPPFPEGTRRRFLRTARGFPSAAELTDWLASDIAYFAHPNAVAPATARAAAVQMIRDGFSPGAFARQYLAIVGSTSDESMLRHVNAPALVVAGAEDRCIPAASSRRVLDRMPHAELHVVQDMGHTIEPPAIDLILDWLRAGQAGTGTPCGGILCRG